MYAAKRQALAPRWIATAAVTIAFITFNESVVAVPPAATEQPKVTLAYIYKSDDASAESFGKLLAEAGYSLRLIQLDHVKQADFDPCAAILIGSDTYQSWKGAAQLVNAANKPILGLGEGGYDFFGDLKLAIGDPEGWHMKGDIRILPVKPTASRFWSTSKVDIKAGAPIALYKKSDEVGIYVPKPKEELLLIAREEKNAVHFPLIQQGTQYVLWGFTAGPDQMTDDGKQLFIHTCRYAVALGKPTGKEEPTSKKRD